ncbi:metalloprotease family protein [Thermococcus onnurineus]|nr:metalloprotease family protein [Thermococcus onnurineus]
MLFSLAPLLLSAVSFSFAWLLRSNLWALVYVFNTAGMAGDFLTALALLRMPPDAAVFDDGTVLRSDEEIPRPYPRWVSSAIKVVIALAFLVILIFGRIEVVIEK